MDILFYPNSIGPVKPVDGQETRKPETGSQSQAGDFAAVLRDAVAGRELNFSAHAMRRLNSRGIEPGPDVLSKLGRAVERAAEKGSRDSLILVDSLAFIVAVKNRTVVTAFEIDQLKDDIVTNIDSAVIA